MTITALPTPPSRDDPANFATRADAFLGALPDFATEANALAAAVNADEIAADASATAAASSASAAASSASSASSSASAASSSASAASASASAAAASYDSFDDRYLGAKSSDPSLDNDGNALLTGALYWNTTVGEMRVYSGTVWVSSYLTTGAQTISGVKTFSSNPVLSGGTANGVLYLDGSKVATSGSALTFDGTNLGVGIATPANTYSRNVQIEGSASAGIRLTSTSYTAGFDVVLSAGDAYLLNRNNTAMIFGNNGSEQMRLTSTGLGIGTSSPAFKLQVNGSGSQFALVSTTDTTSTTGILFGDSASNTVGRIEYVHSDNGMRFFTNGNTQATLDSSGNLGLGVTPSAWNSVYRSMQIGTGAALSGRTDTTSWTEILSNAYRNAGGGWTYLGTAAASTYLQEAGVHKWNTAASGTAGNTITFSQVMTLDASGNLGVGQTSPSCKIQAEAADGAAGGAIKYTATGVASGYMSADADGLCLATDTAGITFRTGISGNDPTDTGTERARITSGGYFKASDSGAYIGSTGAYHELVSSTGSATAAVYIRNTNATSPAGIDLSYSAASPNGTGNIFLYCQDSTALRMSVRSNGGIANYQSNNVDLSDARTKKDINPAASMWNKIGALEIVTYKYNDQTHDDVNVGVIAQQVERVEPVWVDADGFGDTPEDGVPLKTVYTKDITFAAIKALQEAMARIETLEAKVSALEGTQP